MFYCNRQVHRDFLITLYKEKHRSLLVAGMETGLDVNCEKTNCVVMSRDQNAGRSHSTKTHSIPFQRVEGFRYLGATLTHQTSIKEEIKSSLKSRNASYHLVQYILFSRLLSKNINIKIHRIIILPAFYMHVNLGRSHWRTKVDWGCLKIGCWGGYLLLTKYYTGDQLICLRTGTGGGLL